MKLNTEEITKLQEIGVLLDLASDKILDLSPTLWAKYNLALEEDKNRLELHTSTISIIRLWGATERIIIKTASNIIFERKIS